MSHCAVGAEMPKSAMMDGIAGDSSVWFKTARNVPPSMTATMTACFLVRPMYVRSPPSGIRPNMVSDTERLP